MNDEHNAIEEPLYPDRKPFIIGVGVAEIILGIICFLLSLFSMVSLLIPRPAQGPPVSMSMIAPAVVLYLLLSLGFVWLGIGSIMLRRWARALMLVFSWVWLVSGCLTVIAFVFTIPGMKALLHQQTQSSGAPVTLVAVIVAVSSVLLFIMYVAIPGAFVLFLGSRAVKDTFDYYAKTPCWTDRCPLPVLGLCVVMALGLLFIPYEALFNFVMPFFGMILKGAAGAVVCIITAALSAFICWGAYRLRTSAWWCALAMTCFWSLSSLITFPHVKMLDYYRHMGYSKEYLDYMEKQLSVMQVNTTMVVMTVGSGLVIISYLIYIKRFFKSPERDAVPASDA